MIEQDLKDFCFKYHEEIFLQLVVPEKYVSFPSRIFYGWVTPLILQGYKTPLTEKDCWELTMAEKTFTVVNQVRNYLKE